MDLNTLANLGEFVAGLGVIVSLIYLAVQVRQNTAQVRAGPTQAYSDALGDLVESIYASPEMMEFFARALGQPETLSEAEWLRWHLLITRVARHFDAAFYQYRTGTMDEEMWRAIESSMIGWWRRLGWWSGFGAMVNAYPHDSLRS